MAFYIRQGNFVLREIDLVTGPKWSEITNKTSRIQVCAFTTRRDAEQFAPTLQLTKPYEICNHLDFIGT